MFKKSLILVLCLLSASTLFSCAGKNQKSNDGKIKVSVTFDAMKEFTQAVGGNKVEISTIIPDGTEPHDFEPKPRDIAALSSADVFVYNGMDMELWANNAITASGNKNLVSVEASKGVTPIDSTDSGTSSDRLYDPHVWISLKGAEIEVTNIKDALVKVDPSNSSYYEKNCADFISQLESLYKTYQVKFNAASTKDFVTGHAAFAYMCRDFGLKQNSVEDVFADGEPSAQKLKQLIDYCKANNVKTVFVEDMVSPAVSNTLASAVGAKVEKIYTIESSEGGKTYIERMKDNLNEIYASLNQQ